MTIKIQPARTITDGIVMSNEAFLEVSDAVPLAFTKSLNYYVADGHVKIVTASVEQPEPVSPTTQWVMTAPDGTKFAADTPLRAASKASNYRLEIDPVAAKNFLDAIETIRKEGEEEHDRCMEEYGTLNCPACGGSGHIGDVTDGDTLAAALAQPELMVDMTPPATSRDRWMYEQGRLAERDPRSHVAQPEPVGLTDGQIEGILGAAYLKLVAETGYNGGMGGKTWDIAAARAVLAAAKGGV